VTIEDNIENNRALVRRQFEEVINRNMSRPHSLTAILPCNDLDASEAFYARLGFTHREGDDDYRMLSDGRGGELHLTAAVEGWLVPGRNPFGLYLYVEGVDELAARMGCRAEDKPWGMYEFAVSDPDETLVRVGWPTRLRKRD
jgi:catechol 2,3-dioxygenase-like lactoylglutathione lyase family enzyme